MVCVTLARKYQIVQIYGKFLEYLQTTTKARFVLINLEFNCVSGKMEADPDLVFHLPTQVKGVRERIQECFQRSHEALRVRENALLSQIDEIKKEYDSKFSDFFDTLGSINTVCADAIKSESFSVREKAIDALVRPKMDELRDTRCLIVFNWDDNFFDKIENLGSVTHVSNKTNPDALAKVHQIVYKSKSPATGSTPHTPTAPFAFTAAAPQSNTPTSSHSPTHASFNTGSNQPDSDVSKGVIKTAKRSSLYKKH